MRRHRARRARAAAVSFALATVLAGGVAVASTAGVASATATATATGAATHRSHQHHGRHGEPTTTRIKQDWQAFFSGKTPAKKKVALVQHGKVFASVIRAQSRSALATSTSAKVTKVSMASKTEAHVVYTVYLAGKPALKGAKGTSLYLQHRWKVSASSFCALLGLEQAKPAACAKVNAKVKKKK